MKDNFYYLKELQWTNQAMKLNHLNAKDDQNSVNYLKEKSWNKRFIYNKIQKYDSSKDKNIIANLIKNDNMNCYHNAMKKNNIILKSFYSMNKGRRKSIEYNKTNIKINYHRIGKNMKKSSLINNSFSSNIYLNKNKYPKNRNLSSDFIENKNNINKILNQNHNSPDKLTKIWNDLCILEPYRELFNILITQLSSKKREDFCEREFNDLYELKNDLQFLSTSVFYRNQILESLNYLNDRLGQILKSKQNLSNEVVLKKICKKIENLREHTVNICFLMKKIKSKINEGHSWGKFDIDSISQKYKFDKNYLIKMKEEMCVLKEGYTKYFFDIGEDSCPFLLNTSEPNNRKNKELDPFFHKVPLSNEMREKINQSIYIIYQELIGYQNNNVSENNFRNISPLKKYKYTELDVKIYKKHNESFNSSINNSKLNLTYNILLQRSGVISPSRTIYSGVNKSPSPSSIYKDNNLQKKRILSGTESGNNKYFSKLDKNSNFFDDKTSNNINNNNDIKDLKSLNYEKDNTNIEIDINNKNEENKDKMNNNDINKENMEDINVSDIKKDENNENKNILTEKDESNINNDKNFNLEKIEEDNYVNENNNIKQKANGNININDKIEENIEEEKLITESRKDDIKDENENENKEIININNNKNDNTNNENFKIKKEDYDDKNGNIQEVEINPKNNNKNKEIKSKNYKISIFNEDINKFVKDFYNYYYISIPQSITHMFDIDENLIKIALCGLSPYIFLVHEINNQFSVDDNNLNWINIKNNILGICLFNFFCKNGVIKLIITHISISNSNIDTSDEIEFIKQIFNQVIEYIKKNFYFDEIEIGYNCNNINEEIFNIFLNDLNFKIVNDTKKEEKNKNKDEEYKFVYTNNSSKNKINDLLRQSIQKHLSKNIFDIFDSLVIASNIELEVMEKDKNNDANLINNILLKYILEKKERTNVNRLYNKISNLDQLIKLFQNNNINNKEIPLSLAENRFDILSSVINKNLLNSLFNNLNFFNNYNLNISNSYLDENTGVYYNFIKAEKILIIENNKNHIKFCHIINNNLSLFLCKINSDISTFLNKNNIYIQLNDIYKEALLGNKRQILKDKIIWMPCFEIYHHYKALSNNSVGSIHEYVKISNQIINQTSKELFRINSNNKDIKQMIILPDLSKDIFIDNDFIFGIINNSDSLNEKDFENSDNNEEDKIINNKDEPYIIFLNYIKKADFIHNDI